MLVRPQALADSPTRALALFALVPLFALSVFAADLSDAAGAGSILWPLILAILGTVALAAGVRVDHERGPLNAALLISQIAGLAASMVAINASASGSSRPDFGWAIVIYTTGLMHLALGILVVLRAMPTVTKARRGL